MSIACVLRWRAGSLGPRPRGDMCGCAYDSDASSVMTHLAPRAQRGHLADRSAGCVREQTRRAEARKSRSAWKMARHDAMSVTPAGETHCTGLRAVSVVYYVQ